MMSVVRARLAVAMMLGCAACSPPAPQPVTSREVSQNEIDAAAAPAEMARPAFALNEVEGHDMLARLGEPWSGEFFSDKTRPDDLTNGYIRTILHRTGSAEILTLPDARVWRVELRTGSGDRCGQPSRLLAALPKVLAIAAPGTTVNSSTMGKLAAALNDTTVGEAQLAHAKVTVSGECVPSMYVTAS